MVETISGVDTGTGYGRAPSSHNARLTEVGPGTPMGEAMRRYWHPVASSSALSSEVPHRVKVLGENLIVFRDGSGRAGVVFERCAHRGTSLYYGRVEEDGIRCCYHGWKFDVQGRCLEQACEPERGRRRDAARQPWYPVEEHYGLVFVYMGPPERKPALPRYKDFEELDEGESIFSDIPVPGMDVTGALQDCNWLQTFENVMDPVHVLWLHYAHSGAQFEGTGGDGFPHSFFNPYRPPGAVTFEKNEHGTLLREEVLIEQPDGSIQEYQWRMECHLPNIILLPDYVKLRVDQRHDCLLWVVPRDDTSCTFFISVRATSIDRLLRVILGVKQNGKFGWEIDEEERQRYPSDAEAQISQGPITQHSEETLVTSDKGVVMLRRMLNDMVDDVEAGRDPKNVEYGQARLREFMSGLFTVDRKADAARTPAAVT